MVHCKFFLLWAAFCFFWSCLTLFLATRQLGIQPPSRWTSRWSSSSYLNIVLNRLLRVIWQDYSPSRWSSPFQHCFKSSFKNYLNLFLARPYFAAGPVHPLVTMNKLLVIFGALVRDEQYFSISSLIMEYRYRYKAQIQYIVQLSVISICWGWPPICLKKQLVFLFWQLLLFLFDENLWIYSNLFQGRVTPLSLSCPPRGHDQLVASHLCLPFSPTMDADDH